MSGSVGLPMKASAPSWKASRARGRLASPEMMIAPTPGSASLILLRASMPTAWRSKSSMTRSLPLLPKSSSASTLLPALVTSYPRILSMEARPSLLSLLSPRTSIRGPGGSAASPGGRLSSRSSSCSPLLFSMNWGFLIALPSRPWLASPFNAARPGLLVSVGTRIRLK